MEKKKENHKSKIGGQALIEGVMMKGIYTSAMACRLPDGTIDVETWEEKNGKNAPWYRKTPFIRGTFNFVSSLIDGYRCLMKSADKQMTEEESEEEMSKLDKWLNEHLGEKLMGIISVISIVFSLVLCIGLFKFLPMWIVGLLKNVVSSRVVLTIAEGLIKIAIFVGYLAVTSLMKDIRRTYEYHGAEHKCINCIENGARLTVDNVRHSSRYHKRCGTSFLFLVMFISVIFFIFIRVDNTALQLIIRILLIPVVAGVSYEIIRWAGKNDNGAVNVISKPGMWLQRLTTKEPDDDMIEVAIKAVEAVFDVDAFLKEYYADSENPEADMEAVEAEMALTTSFNVDEENKSRVIRFEKAEKDDDDDDDFFNQENFNRRFEESDQSESTAYDNDYSYDEDEYEEQDEYGEEQDGFDETYETGADDGENGEYGSETAQHHEENSDEDTDDGFEFLDDDSDILEDDTYAEDVPVFKQRRTE